MTVNFKLANDFECIFDRIADRFGEWVVSIGYFWTSSFSVVAITTILAPFVDF